MSLKIPTLNVQKKILKIHNFDYLFTQHFINGKWKEERQHHCPTPLVSCSPWERETMFLQRFMGRGQSHQWEDWVKTSILPTMFFVCSDSSKLLEIQSRSQECSISDKCLKYRHSKIILTLIRVKIHLSSALHPIISPVPVTLYHGRKKPYSHAQI